MNARGAVARAICKTRLYFCCQKHPGQECVALVGYGDEADAALAAILISDEVIKAAKKEIRRVRNSENFCGICDRWPRSHINCSCEAMARAALEAALAAWRK